MNRATAYYALAELYEREAASHPDPEEQMRLCALADRLVDAAPLACDDCQENAQAEEDAYNWIWRPL